MIQEVLFLQSSFFYGGSIGSLLARWEQIGVFSYVLPFLIIFALIFATLNQLKIFSSNKAISSILGLTVAIMSLQFDFVPRFFSEIFPRLGVGLAVILVFLIILGIFIDPTKGKSWFNIIMIAIGAIVVVVVLINTAGAVGWSSGYFIEQNWQEILGVVVFLVIVGVIIGSVNRDPNKQRTPIAFWPND